MAIDTSEEDNFSYTETSAIAHAKMPEHLNHTERCTLRRIAEA